MSILNVEHLSHGFGDRAIFQDAVSYTHLTPGMIFTQEMMWL